MFLFPTVPNTSGSCHHHFSRHIELRLKIRKTASERPKDERESSLLFSCKDIFQTILLRYLVTRDKPVNFKDKVSFIFLPAGCLLNKMQ